jgi:uncharacterized MAPEG superfamily protein
LEQGTRCVPQKGDEMTGRMTPDLWWLVATTALTASLWVPYIANRMREHGPWVALQNPNHDERPKAKWADRLMWAHANAVENLVVFAPLVLIAHVLGVNSAATATAAAVYFFARLAHAVIYTAGVPVLRTVAFLVAVGAQVTFAVAALAAIG